MTEWWDDEVLKAVTSTASSMLNIRITQPSLKEHNANPHWQINGSAETVCGEETLLTPNIVLASPSQLTLEPLSPMNIKGTPFSEMHEIEFTPDSAAAQAPLETTGTLYRWF